MRKMKDSGVEWIGEIPEDWEVVKLKHIASAETTGLTAGTLLSSGSYPVYDANAVIGFINQNPMNEKYISVIKDGAGIGRTRLMPKDTSVTGTLNAIKVHHQFDLEYLFLILQVFDFNVFSVGSTIPHVYFKDYSESFVPYPCRSAQKDVVKKTNIAMESIDQIKSDISDAIQTLEAYKKSVITEAVTKGLDKNAEMKDSGIEWIGEIPKHWHLVKLKFLTETIAKGISPNYTEEELSPVVNQATFSKGYFDYNLKYCSDELKGDGLLKKNDVLLATTGGGVLGKTFYFQENGKYLASTDVAYLRCKSKETSKFIYYILSVNYDLLNGEFAKGSTNQTHLQMDRLNNMEIPWPVDNELKDILTKIDHSSEVIDEVIAIKQNQLSHLDEYKKSLIYEYVTGKREV